MTEAGMNEIHGWWDSEYLFTQCVDDAHGQLNTKEHEGPSPSPESPCLHAVVLVFPRENFLQTTIQQHQVPAQKTAWKI